MAGDLRKMITQMTLFSKIRSRYTLKNWLLYILIHWMVQVQNKWWLYVNNKISSTSLKKKKFSISIQFKHWHLSISSPLYLLIKTKGAKMGDHTLGKKLSGKTKKKTIWELQSLFKIICPFWISYEFVAQHEYNLVIKSREPYCTWMKTLLRKFSGMIQIKILIWMLLTWLGIYWKLPMFWKAFNKYTTWKCWMYRGCSQTETVNWQCEN